MPDERVDKALKDPAFLSMSDDEQIAVLKHYKENPAPAKAASAATSPTPKISPPPKWYEDDPSSMASKLGRGAVLGGATGLGIPESTNPAEVVGGAIKNVGQGYLDVGKSVLGIGKDTPTQAKERTVMGPLGPTVGNIARGIESGGGEAWKGMKDKDPEAFAHGLASALTQIVMLGAMRKGIEKAGAPDAAMRQARISTAIGAGAEEHAAIEKSMPKIVEQAQSAGIKNVQDLGKSVERAHTAVNDEFDRGFAPIAQRRIVPMDISRRILRLITPDMRQTAEGRAAIQKIQDAAVEYQKDWSLDELNHRRMNVDKALASHYKKASMGQYADPVEAEIREAERSGAADIVYTEWGRANPGKNVRALKEQHGALWKLDDAINGSKGAVNKLKAEQGEYKAEGGKLGRLRGGVSISQRGLPHGYLAGVADALFHGGPLDKANSQVSRAFNPSLSDRAAKLGTIGFPARRIEPPPQVDDQ
jgi:hypothetical protein